MTREEFEHVLRAAAEIVHDELVVVGSQAVLAAGDDIPDTLLRSREVDLFPKNDPDRAEEIDGAIGDGSQFHGTYGYYAHGVGPETVHAPAGWEGRLVRQVVSPLRRSGAPVIGWCLETHDLVLAKLAAGRPHDYEFAQEAVRSGLADVEQLRLGVDLMPDAERELVRARLEGLIAKLDRESTGRR